MAFERDNLTNKQNSEWALYLPALSSFYISDIGKQRYDNNWIPQSRIPTNFELGVDGMDFLKSKDTYYSYKWCLYSAGHANRDLTQFDPKEDVPRNRDKSNTFVLQDSGGYQIGTKQWPADWQDPNCPKAQKYREEVLTMADALSDYCMALDVPAWIMRKDLETQQVTNIHSYSDSLKGTFINNDYFINNRNGNCKFLNTLHGETHSQADDWYDKMKKYNDPKQYPDRFFEGYAFAGQYAADVHLILKRLVSLKFDGLLESGKHDWIHVLGTSMLEWAVLLTDIQKAARKYYNPTLTISYDCASPFFAAAKGLMYYETYITDREKWAYRMGSAPSDKSYSTDNRSVYDAIIQDRLMPTFSDSVITKRLKIADICYQQPGALNKLGKESKTAWDSFTYNLIQAHNVWCHIKACQDANVAYENGKIPAMLVQEEFDRISFQQVIDDIFSTTDRSKAEQIIEDYSNFWIQIKGTRGNVGKKSVNAITHFNNLFE